MLMCDPFQTCSVVSYYCLVWEASSLVVLYNYQKMQYVKPLSLQIVCNQGNNSVDQVFCIVLHTSRHLVLMLKCLCSLVH